MLEARLVGLMGESGSGKDYVASYIKSKQEYNFDSRAFADPIRSLIFKINPPIISYLGIQDLLSVNTWDDLKSPNFKFPWFTLTPNQRNDLVIKIRELIQLYGEVCREEFGEEHWINLCLPYRFWASAVYYQHLNPNLLITDVRLPIEADKIKEMGGYVIRIVRPDQVKEGSWRNHPTETQLQTIKYDALLINDNKVIERTDKILKAIDEAVAGNDCVHPDCIKRKDLTNVLTYDTVWNIRPRSEMA